MESSANDAFISSVSSATFTDAIFEHLMIYGNINMQKKKKNRKKKVDEHYPIKIPTELVKHDTLWINPTGWGLKLTEPCLKLITFPSEDLHTAFIVFY